MVLGLVDVADEFFVAENINSQLIVEKNDCPQVESFKPLLGLLESHIYRRLWEAPSPIDPRTILKMQHFLTGVAVQIALLGCFQLRKGHYFKFLNLFLKSLIFGFLPDLLLLLDLLEMDKLLSSWVFCWAV
jgi:hypothetical protein